MSLQEELESPDRNIGEELNILAQRVEYAFSIAEKSSCKLALKEYFKLIRQAHAFDMLTLDQMDQHLTDWSRQVSRLSMMSPHTAFFSAYDAFLICADNQDGLGACDKILANTTCLHIAANVNLALKEHVKHASQARDAKDAGDVGYFQLEKVWSYISPLMNVIQTTAPHHDSADLHQTFIDSLIQFENILYSHYVPPTRRFEIATILKNWVDGRDDCNELKAAMARILKDTIYLKDGPAILLNANEEDANEMARETREWLDKKPVDIQEIFTVRAGVAVEFTDLHRKIERAFRYKNYQAAEDKLCSLFYELAQEREDEDGIPYEEDYSSYKYFFNAADRLAEESNEHAMMLSFRCIAAMDEELAVSELIMAGVYELALPAMKQQDVSKTKHNKQAKFVYKTIMMWSSEFEDTDNVDDIFGYAAEGYEACLAAMHPIDRYRDVSELVDWLNERKAPSAYLKVFLDEMMSRVVKRGPWNEIALDCDIPAGAIKAKIYEFKPLVENRAPA